MARGELSGQFQYGGQLGASVLPTVSPHSEAELPVERKAGCLDDAIDGGS